MHLGARGVSVWINQILNINRRGRLQQLESLTAQVHTKRLPLEFCRWRGYLLAADTIIFHNAINTFGCTVESYTDHPIPIQRLYSMNDSILHKWLNDHGRDNNLIGVKIMLHTNAERQLLTKAQLLQSR